MLTKNLFNQYHLHSFVIALPAALYKDSVKIDTACKIGAVKISSIITRIFVFVNQGGNFLSQEIINFYNYFRAERDFIIYPGFRIRWVRIILMQIKSRRLSDFNYVRIVKIKIFKVSVVVNLFQPVLVLARKQLIIRIVIYSGFMSCTASADKTCFFPT